VCGDKVLEINQGNMVIGRSDVDAVRRKGVVGESTLCEGESGLVWFCWLTGWWLLLSTSFRARSEIQRATHRNMVSFSSSYCIDTRDGGCRLKVCG
jgi:hypothetical protein